MEDSSLDRSFPFGTGRVFYKDGWFRIDTPVQKITVEGKKVIIEARRGNPSVQFDVIPLYPDMIEFCQSLGDLNFGVSQCRMRNTDHSVIFEIVAGAFEKYHISPEQTSQSFAVGGESLRGRCGHYPQHENPRHIRFNIPLRHEHEEKGASGYEEMHDDQSEPSTIEVNTPALPPIPPSIILPPIIEYSTYPRYRSPPAPSQSALANPLDYMSDSVLVTSRSTEECTICKSPYDIGEQKRWLPCMHSFHAQCIDRWVNMDREDVAQCPICKVSIDDLASRS